MILPAAAVKRHCLDLELSTAGHVTRQYSATSLRHSSAAVQTLSYTPLQLDPKPLNSYDMLIQAADDASEW